MPEEPLAPPQATNPAGTPRKIGVEIEFGGVDAGTAAAIVKSLYGGDVETEGRHRATVGGTAFGTFLVELDSSYAHPKHAAAGEAGSFPDRLRDRLAPTVGDVISLWMPYEIIAPPITFDRLGELDRLIGALRHQGASGTFESPVFAFGLQLNPEVAATTADYVLRHLRAYLVLSPWLREQIGIDPSRRLLPYVGHFPQAYVRLVTDPAYAPDLAGLIDDYLADNPTRNRELDLLPLFAHLDPDRVRAAVPDPHVKARPTFHYRLPNSRVDEVAWGGVVEEWNRWVMVERLAAEPDRVAEACRDYRAHLAWPREWLERSLQWISE